MRSGCDSHCELERLCAYVLDRDDVPDKLLMQKISGPTRINMRDFTAILLFQERHPDLFTDTPAKDMFAQMNAFNRLFEGSYADEFKTILREI